MKSDIVLDALNGLTERLAAIEHERWSHWQRYLHSKGQRQPDGSIVLPPELVERWEKQMATEYAGLSEKEKNSDREQVQKYMSIIVAALIRGSK
ncbi:hypothetical protein SAMN05414139_10838 [Burkholderia sp. D7]|nr:hypothetical protein SAMN05414139_10838 [Burkholderia sp. D7]